VFGSVKIAREEGVLTLWRGSRPALLTAVPSAAIFFTLVDVFNKKLSSKEGNSTSASLLSGALARTVATTITAPAILLKTRFESNEGAAFYGQKPSLRAAFLSIIKESKYLWHTFLFGH